MAVELTEFAAEQQRQFDTATSPEDRKEHGHFGTPPAIADFMAGMFSEFPPGWVRVLDPGAGVGTLSAAICRRALRQAVPGKFYFELWENDARLIPLLEATMSRCRDALRSAGHVMEFSIRVDDFILENTQSTLFKSGPEATFQLAVLNPPYFKLRKESAQAQAMEHVVHGQPNIYALFMAAATDLLVPGGQMVAITPRSYFNGPYFKRFRKWFFDRLVARQIHIFESRSDAFKADAVLQENVILQGDKGGAPHDIVVTTSQGRDLLEVERSAVAYDKVIDNSNGDHVVRITTNRLEHEIIEAMDGLPCRFRALGYEISTGPVVTFRSTEFLRDERTESTAPLLWMHNVRPFVTQFPPKNGKPTHIEITESSKRLLVPAKTYVLLKRFTAKEEKRRLVAGIMQATDSYSQWVGLENHLNYVYRRGAELSQAEAFGLAAFFNSAFVDRYFRAISGNTQVNATEIRGMPVPDQQTLARIGAEIEQLAVKDQGTVEQIVGQALRLPRKLIHQLVEVAG
ncbi:MAG TPA: Eco57I restriction-modification methylase domain-containing protein [Pirellulaceae bacterium]|nr:Eco57I restriction-modification methylase domain-containing protein [Pirellulaceae bacterium]